MRAARAGRSRPHIRRTPQFRAEIAAGLERYRAKLAVPPRPSGVVLLPHFRRAAPSPIRRKLNAAGLATVRFDLPQGIRRLDSTDLLADRLSSIARRLGSTTGHAVGIHAPRSLATAAADAARHTDAIGALSIDGNDDRTLGETVGWLAQRLSAGDDLEELLRSLEVRRAAHPVRRAAAAAALAAGAVGVTPGAAGAAVTTTWDNSTLSISMGAGDSVVVTCNFGIVYVNGEDPTDGTARCNEVDTMVVFGADGNETINLAGVSPTDYTSLWLTAVRGFPGNDSITGTQSDDQIEGGPGGDTLNGGAGTDTLREEGASFTLTNTSLSDFTTTDTISGFERAWLTGGSGDTVIDASAFSGESLLEGGERIAVSGMAGSGDDTLLGSVGDSELWGMDGENSLRGGPGDDTLHGDYFNPADGSVFAGPDTMEGAGGFDTLRGGSFSDRYVFAPGIGADQDVIHEGSGQDILDFSAFTDGTAFHVDLGGSPLASKAGSGWQLVGSSEEIENALGGSGSDTLRGNDLGNSLVGGAGADTLTGGEGGDTTEGGLGNDVHAFGEASAPQADLIRELTAGGTDEVSFANLSSTDPVTADLRPGAPNHLAVHTNRTVSLDSGASGAAATPMVENLTGGQGNDSLTGSQGINTIAGGGGNDTIGATFKDKVDGGGGTGDRTNVKGFDASEVYNPGAAGLQGVELLNVFMLGGNDNINVSTVIGLVSTTLEGGTGNDTITGASSNDTLNGQAGNDIMDGKGGNDRVNGVDGFDTLSGGDGNDTLLGGLLNDLLGGGAGNDLLKGEDGDDTLNGGDGDDTLEGGPGNDSLNGGAGTNVLIP